MKKILIIGIFSLFSVLAQAEIQVKIEPSQVSLGDAFKLILTQENPLNGGVPDLTGLQHDFAILGTQRSINYLIINGQSQSVNQWIVSLQPKKSGILTIPAIKLGSDQSAPMTINVQANSVNQDLQNIPTDQQDVMLLASVDQAKPYVNQQVIFTVKLFNSKRLLDVDYQGPKVDDALLIPLGDTIRYQSVQNNTTYLVEEQKYAVFPQKSGALKISSPIFSALIYDVNPQKVKVQDKAIDLNVLPIPKEYKGQTWLPAKQVKLTEQYENTSQTIEQGSTLTRTATIEGVALPAQLLPTLHFDETDAFSVYPEKGKERNRVNQGQLVGSSEIKVTYLFNKTGKITIPELKLSWFNTETGKEEVAVLPPRSMEITPSATGTTNKTQPQQISKNDMTNQTQNVTESSLPNQNNWAWIVALIFGVAWIATMGLWAWQRRLSSLGKGRYKTALTELDKACAAGDPIKARDALLKWGALHWPDAPLLNLTDLTKLVRDVHLKKQLHLLSQALYRNEGKTMWRGDELLRSVHAIKRSKSGVKRKSNSLPPINPF